KHVAKKSFDDSIYHSRVTCSIGIDTYDGRGLSSPEDLQTRANMALKESKARGKNRIWLYSGPDTLPDRSPQPSPSPQHAATRPRDDA
ncbi:MAG: hypothetical protein ACE5F1_13305, partial [Planctomycetota bacterium]